ncbi:MAG: hypothetical protein RI894_65 [Bacteroidota bacterium]|jgi:hypothetical protein
MVRLKDTTRLSNAILLNFFLNPIQATQPFSHISRYGRVMTHRSEAIAKRQ